jgi:NUDIX domain
MQVSPGAGFPFVNGVKVISNCSLKVDGDIWPYAEKNAAEIDAHWQAATKSNPSCFNGVVYLTSGIRLSDGVLHASLVRTDFKSYLYWRMHGFPEAGVLDGFGCALIGSSDGDVMLVQQRPGNVNYGFACLPAGFIDERDVLADGTVEISLSAAREVAEELGEVGNLLVRDEGFIIARSNAQLSFAVPFRAPMTTAEFVRLVDEHNAMCADPELQSIVPVGSLGDIEGLPMLAYARELIEALFAAR